MAVVFCGSMGATRTTGAERLGSLGGSDGGQGRFCFEDRDKVGPKGSGDCAETFVLHNGKFVDIVPFCNNEESM